VATSNSWGRIAFELIGLMIPAGMFRTYSSVNKFGRSTNVDANTPTDIWDGSCISSGATELWVPPTVARVHDITSSAAADDGTLPSTGANRVEIQGLDSNWNKITETVILEGTDDVATSNSYLRIFRMKVSMVGSGGENAGDITATAQTDGTITAAIVAGNNQTLMAVYTVPAGKTAYMVQYYSSMNRRSPSSSSVDIRVLVKPDASVSTSPFQLKHILGMFIDGASYILHSFYPFMRIGEKSDIVMRATDCTDNNTDVSAGFDLILKG